MKLQRSELISYEKQWLENHPNVNNNPIEYIAFIDGLNEIITSHEYELDERFVTYGRRDFLRQEFSDYLNEKTYCGRGKYNDAFVNLAEYYTGNTWVNISSIPEGFDFHKVYNADNEYKKEGIICRQEIEIIKEMIQEFREHLNKINNNESKTKLDLNSEDDDRIIDILIEKLKQHPSDSEITVLKLLSPQFKIYDVSQLDKISMKFFEKCSNDIEFINNSNEKIGLIYNLPFKKKNNI